MKNNLSEDFYEDLKKIYEKEDGDLNAYNSEYPVLKEVFNKIIESDFKNSDLFKRSILKKKTYCYDSNPKNWPYWKRYGIEDFLIDIDRKKDVKG